MPGLRDIGSLERGQFFLVKAGGPPGIEIERPAQPWGAVADRQVGIGCDRVQSPGRAQLPVPVIADRDVANLVAQDDVEDGRCRLVPGGSKLGPDRRRGIKAARLQRPRHQGESGQQVTAGPLGHLPQGVVGREVAIAMTEGLQVPGQQGEMQRFLSCDPGPLPIEGCRHAGKAPDQVQGEVDGVQFNMRQRRDQRGPPFGRVNRATRQRRGIDKHRTWRTAARRQATRILSGRVKVSRSGRPGQGLVETDRGRVDGGFLGQGTRRSRLLIGL